VQANYYFILNVKRTATSPEIKAAYKRLAVIYHPDKHQGNLYFEEQFKLVNEAYQILSNPQKRAVYDLKLDYVQQQQRMQEQQRAYYTQQRRPASVRERYYYNRPKKQKLSRRDVQITVGFFLVLFFGILLVKLTMDAFAAKKRFSQAEELINEKNWSGAHSLLSEAIAFNPEFVEAYQKRASINQNVYQNYEAAIEDYNAVVENSDNPKPGTYFARGMCYEKLHDYKQAEASFTQAINTDKNFQQAYFKRGELRLLHLNTWNEAIADLNTYLQKPASAERDEALLYRGFAYYLVDKYEASLQDYKTALVSDNRNGRLYYLIGKTEMALGKPEEACSSFMQAYNFGYEAAMVDWQEQCGQRK
jgi:curved DNA-binding protein CbpA